MQNFPLKPFIHQVHNFHILAKESVEKSGASLHGFPDNMVLRTKRIFCLLMGKICTKGASKPGENEESSMQLKSNEKLA